MQAQVIALTHNLMLGYEQYVADRRQVNNDPEDRRWPAPRPSELTPLVGQV